MKFSLLMQRICLPVSFTLICLVSCSAQTLLTEISTEVNYTETLRGILSGDSMLFAYPEPGYSSYRSGDELKSVWISGSGTMRELNLPLNSDRSLITFVSEGKKEKYYFLESENKKNFLTCLTVDVEAKTDTWEKDKLEIPGLLLGHFFSGDLYLVCTKPTESILHVLRVDNLTVKDEKRFAFPTPLLERKRTSVAFLDKDRPVTSTEAMAAVKIYRRDSLLLISVDEQFDQFDENQIYPKTIIHRLNFKSGRYSNQHILQTSKNFFQSIIFDDHLYRIVSTKEGALQIYNLNTQQEKSIKLSAFNEDPDVFAYRIDEEKNEIGTLKYKKLVPFLNYVTADRNESEVRLRIGSLYAPKSSVPVLHSFGLAGALISAATNTVLMSLPATPVIDSHFYLKGSPDKGFRFTSNSGLMSQVVSEYDLKMATENYKRYTYKRHLYGHDLAYGFYLEHRSDKVKIIKFQRAGSAEK